MQERTEGNVENQRNVFVFPLAERGKNGEENRGGG